MRQFLAIHSKNRRQVSKAITQLNRALNSAISRKQHDLTYVHVRTIFILWVTWVEVSRDCILHSANRLTYADRQHIGAGKNEIERWSRLLDICFKKHYLRPKQKSLNKVNLGPTPYYRYNELKSILSEHIALYIEIRNRLAHGQWSIALNFEGTGKNQKITQHIWTLTKKDILLMKAVVRNFTTVMFDLACSKKTFESRYDNYISKIDLAKKHSQDRFKWAMISIEKSRKRRVSLGYY